MMDDTKVADKPKIERPTMADDMTFIEAELNKLGTSVGNVLREMARRHHGVEIPPMPKVDPAKTSRPVMPEGDHAEIQQRNAALVSAAQRHPPEAEKPKTDDGWVDPSGC
jgi:hypothetical protein